MRLPKRQEKRRFWELVRAGSDPTEAADGAGVLAHTGQGWFRQAGGVPPPNVPEASSNRSLSMSEREEIFAGVERGDSISRIAKLLVERRRPCSGSSGATCGISCIEVGLRLASAGPGPGTIDPAGLRSERSGWLRDPRRPSWRKTLFYASSYRPS
jgi:hypothetical protein